MSGRVQSEWVRKAARRKKLGRGRLREEVIDEYVMEKGEQNVERKTGGAQVLGPLVKWVGACD